MGATNARFRARFLDDRAIGNRNTLKSIAQTAKDTRHVTGPNSKRTMAIPASVTINLATLLDPYQYALRRHDLMILEKNNGSGLRTIEHDVCIAC